MPASPAIGAYWIGRIARRYNQHGPDGVKDLRHQWRPSSPLSTGWPLTNTVLVNRLLATIDELEGAQAERCVALQARRDLIRSTTLFHWWPQRIKKRQGP